MRLLYRFHQFWIALVAKPSPGELEIVRQLLTPELFSLFMNLQPSEQVHSIAIFNQLCEKGINQKDLLVAALLHDVGKSWYPLRIWERVLIVLGQTFIPNKVLIWGQANPSWWRRPFVVARHHPDWGAEMVQAAGGTTLTVNIIRRHQSKMFPEQDDDVGEERELENQFLRELQLLDNES